MVVVVALSVVLRCTTEKRLRLLGVVIIVNSHLGDTDIYVSIFNLISIILVDFVGILNQTYGTRLLRYLKCLQ